MAESDTDLISIPAIVKISEERYKSTTYKATSNVNGNVCRPVILDIRETYFGSDLHKRFSASRDVDLLNETFSKLSGFHPDPYVVNDNNSEKEHDPLFSAENLKKELRNIASNEEITRNSEIFLCVVLAFGGSGYFYLPNKQKSLKPQKFSVNDLLLFFKGNNCPNLILKPKIFILQSCNPNLKKVNRANFAGGLPSPQICRVPIEADILIYLSEVSGRYTDAMKRETKEKRNIDQTACQFVYTLYEEVRKLTDRKEEFEITELIIGVNLSLWGFIKDGYYESDEGFPWNIDPKVPVCIDQLTKKLVLTKRKSSE
ncbi:caspase-3-like [Saccostrea echinata]|uniref:caspase-3-like n=1 Tax=Saccostrea echinata TaxID=191078 RepID=UPI002A814531|nr:caspase-3-like [Saccostrea echinata]